MISTRRHLQYASGHIELGMFKEAVAELAAINPSDQILPAVISVHIDLHMHAKQWNQVITFSQELVRVTPEDDKGWISHAFALRELERIEEAQIVLLEAESHLKTKCGILHYNLACYACLLGNKPEAKRRLLTAFKLDKAWKQSALEDPDLKAMRAMITAMK
jgi:tetratricopeptide (TPR) repeat protein